MFWLFKLSFLFSIIGAIVSMIVFGVALEAHKKLLRLVSLTLVIISYISVFSSITFVSNTNSQSSIVVSKPIDFVKENTDSEQIVWGCDEDQYFENSANCEIIIVDDNVLEMLKYSSLPYLQIYRVETFESITALGKTYYDKPSIRNIYRFYVGKGYLDKSDLDWSLLFEIEDP